VKTLTGILGVDDDDASGGGGLDSTLALALGVVPSSSSPLVRLVADCGINSSVTTNVGELENLY